jgi:asparagine synthase (glutamine-hydrolysing)
MCGIAGVADPTGVREADTHLVDTMLRTLSHRGPDDHVVRSERGAVLGTRRLSIIDIAGGRQPLANEDGTIVASQNGEIYNYVELRRELLANGHSLQSDGDTETLVHLYEEHGPNLVEHLRGMFAIAIWDSKRSRLVLARDRLGKKPLYWRLDGGRLSYGSELKALLADPELERTVDRDALAAYLGYQYVPAPRSILAGVHKLPPACVLVWDGGEPRIERYWTLEYEPKTNRSFADDRDACLEKLREAVRIRLRSDVPVGCFLSGGIDSSVVTALIAEMSPDPVRTFTIGFDVAGFDESGHAAAVARHFGTDHTSEIATLDALSLLPAFAHAYDEPFGDPSAIPTMRVAQLAATGLKVVMTGDGGDEMFAGYTRYAAHERIQRLGFVPRPVWRAGASLAHGVAAALTPGSAILSRIENAGELMTLPSTERYDRFLRITSPNVQRALLGDGRMPSDGDPEPVLPGSIPRDRVDRLLRLDTLTYLPGDLLVKMDRATMACSLEARSPLLDQELAAFAARLPSDRKLRGGQSKALLREVARGLLPRSIVDRPKKGFGVPTNAWFRTALGARFAEVALSPDAYLRDVVDHSVVAQLYSEHRRGIRNHGHKLWALLALELWGRTWLRAGALEQRGA